jgi:hypothetical protein
MDKVFGNKNWQYYYTYIWFGNTSIGRPGSCFIAGCAAEFLWPHRQRPHLQLRPHSRPNRGNTTAGAPVAHTTNSTNAREQQSTTGLQMQTEASTATTAPSASAPQAPKPPPELCPQAHLHRPGQTEPPANATRV